MIILASKAIGLSIVSIRTGTPVGEVVGVLVDPHTLKVAGFWANQFSSKQDKVLLSMNIRELSVKGLVIDDLHDLTDPSDLPKLKEILDIDYQIPGKKILEVKKKIGVAEDFSFDMKDFSISSLLCRPNILGMLNVSNFTVYRKMIKEIDDSHIRVDRGPVMTKSKSTTEKLPMGTSYSFNASSMSE